MTPAATSAEPVIDLVEGFDALLFDLDGVVYVGTHAVPHASAVIREARARGVACSFVTNNAARPAQAVADHLTEIGVAASVSDVITSPQAAVSLLAEYVPDGSRILVIGGAGINEALVDRGYQPVRSLDDEPAAVVQGYSPDLTWRDLAEATFAVRSGLPWIATNPDLTFPTARGVAPGNGAMVHMVARTVGREPDAVAGKPEPPLLHEAIARTSAVRPLMIGDRLDTDIAAGSRIGIPTLLVFTGVTTFTELVGAVPAERPTYLGADLRVLLDPYPRLEVTSTDVRCHDALARLVGSAIEVQVPVGADPWDGVRALAALAWSCTDLGLTVDASAAVALMADATAAHARISPAGTVGQISTGE